MQMSGEMHISDTCDLLIYSGKPATNFSYTAMKTTPSVSIQDFADMKHFSVDRLVTCTYKDSELLAPLSEELDKYGHGQLTHLAVRELVANASIHGLKGTLLGTVDVFYTVDDNSVHMAIRDTGRGLTDSQLHKLRYDIEIPDDAPYLRYLADDETEEFRGKFGLNVVLGVADHVRMAPVREGGFVVEFLKSKEGKKKRSTLEDMFAVA